MTSSPYPEAADKVPADSVPADGVPADKVAADEVPADKVAAVTPEQLMVRLREPGELTGSELDALEGLGGGIAILSLVIPMTSWRGVMTRAGSCGTRTARTSPMTVTS